MKKICFIAQFPPPMHGLAKAVETLYNSNVKQEFEFQKIDITNNRKFIQSLFKIFINKSDLFYFTISQTRGGNLRDLVIFMLLRIQRKKCLIHLHGGYYRHLVDCDMKPWQKKLNYKAISHLAGAIVLGGTLRPIFEGMLSDDRIFVIPNCVDDEYLISPIEFDEKMDTLCQRSIKHVLYLSNFIRTKGYPEVLEMAKMEKERHKCKQSVRFHFDFAGKFLDPKEESHFWNYIKQWGLEKYITYHGEVSGEKKKKLLNFCDIFVLLTRYPKEGQPISILEAMSNGMVIISTNHAGIPDIMQDGVNGKLIRDKDLLAEKAYNYLLNLDDISLKTIGKNNREHILNYFSQEQYISNMDDIFRECLTYDKNLESY